MHCERSIPVRLWRNYSIAWERSQKVRNQVATRAGLRGGQRGKLPRAPQFKGAPRYEIYLFQIKYSFEKFRNSEAIQEYNSILYSYFALSIKGPQQELISLQVWLSARFSNRYWIAY